MRVRVTLAVSFLLAIFSIAEGNPCSQDWVLHGETCYGFGETRVTWGDAAEMCRTAGAKLAEIETSSENDFLKGQASNRGGECYLLAGTDVFHEGSWVWMRTREPISYSDWGNGQPDEFEDGEDCLALCTKYGYSWNDVPCEDLFNFICEMPADETVVG